MRAGHLDKERCFIDDVPGLASYGIRGLRTKNGWEYGALTIDQIEALKTSFFFRSLKLFCDYKTFQILPHGKGTLDEKPTVTSIITILNQEENLWDCWEQEKRQH